jgi:hypothetical protein
MRNGILILVLLFFVENMISAQVFNKKEQYDQAMKIAKQAFDAQQFSEALMFYKEAIDINPDALLPKYKIEDIKTIYIKKELNTIKTEDSSRDIVKTNKRRQKKEEEKEKLIEAKVEEQVIKKMNDDAEKVVTELKFSDIDVIDIDEEPVIDDDIEVDNIQKDRVAGISKIEIKTQNRIKEQPGDSLTLVINSVERLKPEKNKKEEKVVDKPKPVQVVKEKTIDNDENWIEKENEILLKKYPNKKTVENIEKPGKHILRVIMNIDNRVTIYLKVKYDWGAVYFFIDEVGKGLKSISENYFNIKTNLNTYGY